MRIYNNIFITPFQYGSPNQLRLKKKHTTLLLFLKKQYQIKICFLMYDRVINPQSHFFAFYHCNDYT